MRPTFLPRIISLSYAYNDEVLNQIQLDTLNGKKTTR